MKSLFLFYVLSVAVAALNYLFQAAVAKILGQYQYAHFMSEWSLLSTFMFFGSLASYWAALGNMTTKKVVILACVGFLMSASTMVLFHLTGQSWFLSMSLVLAAVAQSFILGKWLGGGRKYAFCVLGLVTSAIKLILVFLISKPETNDFFQAIVLAYYVGTVLVFAFTRNPLVDHDRQKNSQGWLAAIYLAAGTHFLPNADVLWFRYYSSTENLELFSPLTLVTRAVFFLQIIFAQWWLSESVEKIKLKHTTFYNLLVCSIFFSSIISVVFRWSILHFLAWPKVPGIAYFLYAGAYAAATGLFFQFLQLNVVKGLNAKATFMLILMVAPWVFCGLVQMVPIHFLITTASLYLIVLLFIHHTVWPQRNIL